MSVLCLTGGFIDSHLIAGILCIPFRVLLVCLLNLAPFIAVLVVSKVFEIFILSSVVLTVISKITSSWDCILWIHSTLCSSPSVVMYGLKSSKRAIVLSTPYDNTSSCSRFTSCR